MEVFTKS